MRRALRALFLIAIPLALAGCATSWTVDSQVRSFSQLGALPAEPTYRFDRLPSQQAHGAAQDAVEAMAAPALASVGLRRDDAHARYAIQVSARVAAELSPWADPWLGPGWAAGWGYGRGWRGAGGYGGWGWGPGFGPPADPWYGREVSVVMRELPSNRVVYETRARNDGPYSDSRAVLPVMFQAAMQGFPAPLDGERRVDIALPPRGAQPVAPAVAPR
jgi:hypothetical protein